MNSSPSLQELIMELAAVPDHGKAEIINGKIVVFGLNEWRPIRAAGNIRFSLCHYEMRVGGGCALGGSVAYIVDLPQLPHRKAFCPDAAWYTGNTEGMGFPEGSPVFAVEVRNQNEYGPVEEWYLAQKCADYFAAGTKVVWDVDLLSADVISVYRASAPENPTIYRRGQLAEAEPAVPGWTFPVDELFK